MAMTEREQDQIQALKELIEANKTDRERQFDKIDTQMSKMDGKLDAVLKKFYEHTGDCWKEINKKFDELPCVTHGERLTRVEVKAGFWGAIGAAVVLLGAWLKTKLGV